MLEKREIWNIPYGRKKKCKIDVGEIKKMWNRCRRSEKYEIDVEVGNMKEI